MRYAVALVLALTWSLALADDQAPGTDAEYSAQFRCPEALSSDAERAASTKQMVTWVQAHHPDWTLARLIEFRLQLLRAHHCEASLAAIKDHAAAQK